ncbi:pre-mRNA cleavage complex 2 protein Pcf11 [Dunckerocampus dactyliophorus]|uniref:pre-mRNA cleavage complex 2 protein Pcf11 n=1 Tax=Dunckerocampus dactyliophorus TaxID=161453 RepID=UPI0024071EBE|nr:pre-mRNA cleavage complex 2 protein Pcf11 [Dunckerocampus dactyliophorus]
MDCLLINGHGSDKVGLAFPRSFNSKMDDSSAAREDACREYQSSLEDLTFNSKPHINMLTILAEENVNFAKDIVAIIEAQISKAPATEKLPVLYLVDSIVKNVGGEYLAVFAKNLITSFICVFEKVDENTRKSLFKLRSTWDEVFPLKKLYALDVRVNSVDPAWPIKPLPPIVNASIHVNPKFLKQSEDASPKPTPVQQATPVAPVPGPPPVSQSSLTQEQLIRQQLLAKQKQLLELQQKKIELELEQTKAQLAGGFTLLTPTPLATPTSVPKPVAQPTPVVRPWIAPQPPIEPKLTTRDPRLNRIGPSAPLQGKEHPAAKKESPSAVVTPVVTPEKRVPEKPVHSEKVRIPRKEDEKPKLKSPSPMAKNIQSKTKHAEIESQKCTENTKKDARVKKRGLEKGGEAKDDEQKEKKRCNDKREESARRPETPRSNKGKLQNGLVTKHGRSQSAEKTGGNARTHARKRTRSRSRSRSSTASPKRKDRRSPKSRTRSSSLSPSPSRKVGKCRRRGDEPQHGKSGWDDRLASKKNQTESRRSKTPADEHRSKSRDSPRSHDGGSKESKDVPHRWRSGWDENKHVKVPDSHAKPGPQRHKPYSTPTRPTTPRTPKHRLSVDANLQIPEALNSATKKDLLRRASKSLENGEISKDDFLNMAHKIKNFFQYQEEKQQQRTEIWDNTGDFTAKKQMLPAPQEGLDQAQLTYYEHKSKLKKTQVTHRAAGENWEGAEECDEANRVQLIRQEERRSKEREESRPPLAPMVEEYNHGKQFPPLKSLPGLRFRRRADPRESSEREWNSPLTERQRFDDCEEQKSGYDAPRRYGPSADIRQPDPRRLDGLPPSGATVHRNCPSPAGLDPSVPRFERERLSPLHQKDVGDMSPIPRFESPNSEHSDDGPLNPDAPRAPKAILKGPTHEGLLCNILQQSDSPAHTPPHDGNHPPSRFDMGPSRPHPAGWYEGGAPGRFDGPGRFEGGGPPHHNMPERFDGPHMSQGPMRGGDNIGHFDGPPHPQGPGRFDGPVGPQVPPRFDRSGPGHFEGPMPGFEATQHFDNSPGPGLGPMGFQQQRPMHFENTLNQMSGPICFEGPGHIPQQGGPPRFDGTPGQQGPPRFAPQLPNNLQPAMRPMAPPMYDNTFPPQQNFNMAPPAFPDPMNSQFHSGPIAFPTQPNMQPAANFNILAAPPFSQPGAAPFFNPSVPAVNMQQPVNVVNMNQPFLPQNPATFGQQENHFGQVDVNDLLSKLISTGIIKPSQPETTVPDHELTTSTVPPPAAEEEEDEEAEDDFPDLTNFKVDDMKQRYESVVTKLYSGNQCCLCSMRFTTTQTDLYADHLDWHFRQNHAGKVAGKKITHRRWYYSLVDWIEFEEIADLEERAKSHFFEKENEEEVQKNQAAAKEKEFQSVKATKDQVGESCEICQEPFETYWVEEEEDWFLKNAIRVDDKNFHPACFEDYKNTSSYLDVTPSPNKVLTDHPLSAFIKTEEDDKDSSCSIAMAAAAALVKHEASSEAGECEQPVKTEEELLTDVQLDEKSL